VYEGVDIVVRARSGEKEFEKWEMGCERKVRWKGGGVREKFFYVEELRAIKEFLETEHCLVIRREKTRVFFRNLVKNRCMRKSWFGKQGGITEVEIFVS